MKRKYFYGAALASLFVTGLGQVIKGESEKGLLLILCFYIVLPAAVYISLLLSGVLFPYLFSFIVIFGIILWLYGVLDALTRT